MSLVAMVAADRVERLMPYYDWWIRAITFGRDQAIHNAVLNSIKPGDRLLDVGCGTGTLAVLAALKGAQVVGVDGSRRMLTLARAKANQAGVRIDFRLGRAPVLPTHGVVFDVASATFLLSELSGEEATLTIRAMAQSLRPGGRLIIADEGLPHHMLLRLASAVQRLLFAVIAFTLLEQLTPTRRQDWRAALHEAGLVVREEQSFQDGALRLVTAERPAALPSLRRPIRPLATALPTGFRGAALRVAAWLALPIPIHPGVYTIGVPDPESPVLLTGNFLMTVDAVHRAVANMDCYLIVEDSNGWNVWCASDAGGFTAEKAAALIDLYDVANVVSRKTVVIPRLAGRIRAHLAELSGWDVITGPIEARDVPEFLATGEVTPMMRSLDRMYRLPERVRVAALTTLQLPMWLLPLRLVPHGVQVPVWRFAVLASWILPLCHYRLPGQTGVLKGGALGLFASALMLPGEQRRWRSALAVLLSAPFIGWIYQSTTPVVYWKRIWR
jgi:ubiquinone/menaquinone biosynthesis C-methylase UbiE